MKLGLSEEFGARATNDNPRPATPDRVVARKATSRDNGHHRHYFSVVEPIEFVSFEDTEERFEQDWIALKDKK